MKTDGGKGEAVGYADVCPGSGGGFTMAVFKSSDVPEGSALYTAPQADCFATLTECPTCKNVIGKCVGAPQHSADMAAMRLDAERYRWIKENTVRQKCEGFFSLPTVDAWEYRPGPELNVQFSSLDAAIDAALQEVKQKGG